MAENEGSATHYESQSLKPYVVVIAGIAAIGGFLFGFDSGVINGAVGAIEDAFNSDSVGTGFNVASMLLGCAFGAMVAGSISDRIGRRPSMVLAAVLFLVSAIGSGAATDAVVFVWARIIGGVAVGAASVLAPAYISEVSPARFRGRLASLQQLAIVVGILVAFLSNYLIALASGGARETWLLGFAAWRWMFWVECIPALAFGIGALIAPESPRFLVACQKEEAAKTVLRRIQNSYVVEKIQDIRHSLRTSHKPRFSDVIEPGTRNLRLIVWLGIGLSVFQQFVGINVIFYYGEVLWRSAGFAEGSALLINVVSGSVNVGATFVAIALIDRIGRKPLLLVGSAGMAVMLGAMAVVFASSGLDAEGNLALGRTAGTVSLVAAHLYIFFFAISWGPVVWVMLGEMFNNRYRGAALGLAAGAQWMANFAITMTFPILLATVGLGGAYGLYAVSAAVSLLFVGGLIRETRGKSLEEM